MVAAKQLGLDELAKQLEKESRGAKEAMTDWLKLNVGGTIFETSRATLTSHPTSSLARMFEPNSNLPPATITPDGVYLIDACPAGFSVILNWLSVFYGVWWIWDVQTCNTGGRKGFLVPWVRSLTLWRWYRDYFPIRLVKTSNLDPDRNYLICCHPHGILCFGASCSFGTESCDFSRKFPGVTPHLTTIEGNLWMPMF